MTRVLVAIMGPAGNKRYYLAVLLLIPRRRCRRRRQRRLAETRTERKFWVRQIYLKREQLELLKVFSLLSFNDLYTLTWLASFSNFAYLPFFFYTSNFTSSPTPKVA